MRVAERHVSAGDTGAVSQRGAGFRDGNPLIRERRTADLREGIQTYRQPFANVVEVRDLFECTALATLGSLRVTHMQRRQTMRLVRNRSRDAGVHASAEQHYAFWFFSHGLSRLQTPFIAGSQMNLCNCRPSRTGKPSARIHSASSRALSPSHFPAGSRNTGEKRTWWTRAARRCCTLKSRANS